MPRTLVKRELTLATYFLKQDWLLKEFFYRLFLRAPLPQTSFLFPFPSSCCPVFVPWITVLRFLCLFLSVLLLFPLLHSCMCTEIQHICADNSLSWSSHLTIHKSDDHPSFHFISFLACFYGVLTTASLNRSHEQSALSMQYKSKWDLLLVIQSLKN